jgi:hypothetical protein
MPGGGFKKDAAAMKADRDTFMNDPYEFAQQQLVSGGLSTTMLS